MKIAILGGASAMSAMFGARLGLAGEDVTLIGALAAQWLGLSTVLPCHCCTPEHPQNKADLAAFHHHLDVARASGARVPESIVMRAGDWIEVH